MVSNIKTAVRYLQSVRHDDLENHGFTFKFYFRLSVNQSQWYTTVSHSDTQCHCASVTNCQTLLAVNTRTQYVLACCVFSPVTLKIHIARSMSGTQLVVYCETIRI